MQDDSQSNDATAEELARFREEWKADLNQRLKRTEGTQKPSESTELTAAESIDVDATGTTVPKRPVKPVSPSASATSASGAARGPGFTTPLSPTQSKALDLYRRAVAHEQKSELDEALRLYRQAFRVYEDIARLYDRLEFQTHTIQVLDGTTFADLQRDHKLVPVPSTARLSQDLEKLHIKAAPSVEPSVTLPANHGVVTGTLASIMAPWASLELKFEPEIEKEPVPLQRLPDELMVHTLEFLDTTTLERFALVNRKARVLTLDSALWRYALVYRGISVLTHIALACKAFRAGDIHATSGYGRRRHRRAYQQIYG